MWGRRPGRRDRFRSHLSQPDLNRLHILRWAENIAQFQSAQAAVRFWSTSPAHRSSMLNCMFNGTGLAVIRSNSGRLYWTETFGG
ncbi:MAG: CAP domain-containing protein [Pseudonocardiaceae bacterium]